MADKDQNQEHDDLSPEERRKRFWDRLEGINAGMLGLAEDMRLVPMSHTADREAHALWFITAKGQHLVDGVDGGPKKALHVIADAGGKLYARIEGQLELVHDEAKLDELWNPVADSWFDQGRKDPDVRLLKLPVAAAEVWTTSGGLNFILQIAKSKLTGADPDMGEHFTV